MGILEVPVRTKSWVHLNELLYLNLARVSAILPSFLALISGWCINVLARFRREIVYVCTVWRFFSQQMYIYICDICTLHIVNNHERWWNAPPSIHTLERFILLSKWKGLSTIRQAITWFKTSMLSVYTRTFDQYQVYLIPIDIPYLPYYTKYLSEKKSLHFSYIIL